MKSSNEKRKKSIAERLRLFRKSRHFTQEIVCRYFECGRANYSRIEKGEVWPNIPGLFNIKEQLGLSIDWLLTGDGELEPGPEHAKNTENTEMRTLMKEMAENRDCFHFMMGQYVKYKAEIRPKLAGPEEMEENLGKKTG